MRALAVLIALTACGETDLSGPQTVRLLGRDDTGAYGLVDARIDSLSSTRHIRGGAGAVRGGGVLFVEETLLEGDLALEAQDDVHQSALIDGDRPVDADYSEAGELLIPRDWETLLMFSFYHHLEQGLAFYGQHGAATEAAPGFTAHFNVRFTLLAAWGTTLIEDNAAFAPLADALLLFPRKVLEDGVPLAANEGVVVHELSHGVKHRIVSGSGLPLYAKEGWQDRAAINSFRADDEGLADFMAAVFTGDPDYIEPSLPGVALDRDVSRPRPFSQDLDDALADSVLIYNPYPLGSALASFLWATAEADPQGRDILANVIIDTLRDLGPRLDQHYRLPLLLDALMAHAPPTLRARGCQLLDERTDAAFRPIPTCGL